MLAQRNLSVSSEVKSDAYEDDDERPELRELTNRLLDARRRSDELFALVRETAVYERPIPERHRIIFYVGHLEAFDWNLLSPCALNLKSVNPDFDRLFAFGIDPVGGGLPDDVPADWPSVEAVRKYVDHVRNALNDGLADAILDPDAHGRDGYPLQTILNVAVEHRLMHVETLAYILHQLPLDMKLRQPQPAKLAPQPFAPGTIRIPAGKANLGLRRSSGIFGWDNEYEAHSVDVPDFEIDRYKVTNSQYLEFLSDGGYEAREFWKDDDWQWIKSQKISHPLFWNKTADGWLCRTMFDEVPLPLDWPVYVSHAEASAYARWAGKSLPTEAEWHRAAYASSNAPSRTYPWGDEPLTAERGNFDLRRWDPAPVNAYPQGRSAFGVCDMVGNGWEWTSTPLGPFPGFEPFAFYKGYSADFFDGKHFVMKGGSPRTAACMLRPSFRNWFQSHYQYVYSGFRCANY